MLFLDGSLKKSLNSDFGMHAFVDNGVGNFSNWDRNTMPAAKLKCGNAGINPFDGHPDFLASAFGGKTFGNKAAVAIVAAVS